MNKVDDEKNLEGLQGRFVYLLSPVRDVTPEQDVIIQRYAKKLKLAGAVLFNLKKDADQLDPTGYNIVMVELNFLHEAAKNGGRVDILWNAGGKPSEGSRVDVGMALSLGLELRLVEVFNLENPTGPQKCFSLLTGWGKEVVENTIENMRNSNQVIVAWDIEMKGEVQEWQRIYLGESNRYRPVGEKVVCKSDARDYESTNCLRRSFCWPERREGKVMTKRM